MSGGVCDLPGERCFHPISCEERGCVKQRPAPTPKLVATPCAAVEVADINETIRRVEYDIRHRAMLGSDGFVGERKEVEAIIAALRASRTTPPARTYAEGVSDEAVARLIDPKAWEDRAGYIEFRGRPASWDSTSDSLAKAAAIRLLSQGGGKKLFCEMPDDQVVAIARCDIKRGHEVTAVMLGDPDATSRSQHEGASS